MIERPPESGFTPIHPNPYIVGNPVRGRSMFFGREAEFDLVRRRFQDSATGGLLVFCGERRSGKTSILFQILDGRLGPRFIPVLIDMQSMAVGDEAEFLTRVSEEVKAALGEDASGLELPDFSHVASRSAAFQRFIWDVLRLHPDRKLILLFDEYELFENKIDAGQLGPDVLHILAALMERHPVFLIFTGSQHLEQRRREYWKILGKSLHKMISFLEREDAMNLIRMPVEGRVRHTADALESIWRLTAGQPFYTQAICQSLVDHLNERRCNDATRPDVLGVTDGIVNNPLPQMIFLWDGLERDDKLVLALLAESLAEGSAWAGGDDLARLLRRRQYPLDLDKARFGSTLEKLFKSEMLLRDDRAQGHAYAFRMDLWRLWIRRQHSVWQVMRELGLEIRPRAGRRLRIAVAIASGVASVLAVAAFAVIASRGRSGGGSGRGPVPDAVATLALEAEPAAAAIELDGRPSGFGSLRQAIVAGRSHRVRLRAAGYADTEMVFSLAPGDSVRRRIALRELLGDARIETRPPGAEVRVDGRVVGASPVVVRGLAVAAPHRVEALLAGHGTARRELIARPDTMVSAILALEASTTDVLVTTDPPECEIRLDGVARGRSPAPLAGIAWGSHTLSAVRDGYLPAETTLAVAEQTRQIHLALRPEPPGFLVVQGDRPAEIWIDGVLIVANVQNSGLRRLPPGTHPVRVVLANGETIDHSVAVKSHERATYDFTKGTVTRRPQGEP